MKFGFKVSIIGIFFCFGGNYIVAQEKISRDILPAEVNTEYMEVRPIISANGQKLYFGRRFYPDNIKGHKDLQDIYVAELDAQGKWKKAYNIGEPINNKDANSLYAISPDGNEIIVINTYKKIKTPLASFRREGTSWVGPEPVDIIDYINFSDFIDFHINFQENIMIMAIETDDSKGEQDLYVSFKNDEGIWEAPINMGSVLNTIKSDFSPFLSADGRVLFFASYGHGGKGGSDLFYSFRLDNTWTKWTKPVSLDAPINTSGEETFCSVTDDMKAFYYVSYRTGSEKRDIYREVLPESFWQDYRNAPVLAENKPVSESETENKIAAVNVGKEEKNEPADDMATEDDAGQPEIAAKIIEDQIKEEVANTETNQKTVTPAEKFPSQRKEPTKFASTDANAGTSMLVKETPTVLANINTNLKYVIAKSEQPSGVAFDILRNVYFDFNSAKIKADFQPILDEVASIMSQYPNAQLKLIGHSDVVGDKYKNMEMSRRRSKAVAEYLIDKGVVPEKMLIHFRGESEPFASNDDDKDGRELNRRVDIMIVVPLEN